MKAWLSLHDTASFTPNPHVGMARRCWGGMLSTPHLGQEVLGRDAEHSPCSTSVVPVWSPGLLLHTQELE